MTSSKVGLFGVVHLAEYLRGLGFDVIGGGDASPATATAITTAVSGAADWPLIAADTSETDMKNVQVNLRSAVRRHSLVVVLRHLPEPQVQIVAATAREVELPATIDEILVAAGLDAVGGEYGPLVLNRDLEIVAAAVRPPPSAPAVPEPEPVVEPVEIDEPSVADVVDDDDIVPWDDEPEPVVVQPPSVPVSETEPEVDEDGDVLILCWSCGKTRPTESKFCHLCGAAASPPVEPAPDPEPDAWAAPPPPVPVAPTPVPVQQAAPPPPDPEPDAWAAPPPPVPVAPAPVQQAAPPAPAPPAPAPAPDLTLAPPPPSDPEPWGFSDLVVPTTSQGATNYNRPHSGLGEVIVSMAGKGGVGKSTMSLLLAERAAAVGKLKVVVIDANRGQGDLATYLRLGQVINSGGLPTVYNVAVGADPHTIIIAPEQMVNARHPQLPHLSFGAVFAPTEAYADPHVVTTEVYARTIQAAREVADLVVVDTQIAEAYDTSGLFTELIIPLLATDGWAFGTSDLSGPSVANLYSRFDALRKQGVPRDRVMWAMNRVNADVAFDVAGLEQRFAPLATQLGVVVNNEDLASGMLVGRLDHDNPAVAPVLNAALLRVTGNSAFEQSTQTQTTGKPRWQFWKN